MIRRVRMWGWLWDTGALGSVVYDNRGRIMDQRGEILSMGKPIPVTVTYDNGKKKRRKK